MKRILLLSVCCAGVVIALNTRAGTRGSATTNSIGMKLVLIPPGSFIMGSPETDVDAAPAEKPTHTVRISRAFYLAAHETTIGNFRAFVQATGYKTEAEQERKGGYGWDRAQGKFVASPEYSWDHLTLQ